MKKLNTLILSLSCLFLISATAFAIDPQQIYYQPQSSRIDYYDAWGDHKGYSKKEKYSDQTNHYDVWGAQIGHSKRDSFTGDVNHYDEWGHLQSTVKSRRY